MKFKKLIALGLATIMAVSALTACGDTAKEESKEVSSEVKEESKESSAEASKESEAPAEEEGITFPLAETMEFTGVTILATDQYKMSDNLGWQEFEKYGNISVEFTDMLKGEAAEKYSLLVASDNYPDFVMKLAGAAQTDKFGMDGVYIPLEDLIREYMPNLTALLDERDAWSSITAGDGHIYSLPQITEPAAYGGTVAWINKEWLDTLGLEEPTNPEQLLDCLRAFKTGDPNGNGVADEIPLTFTQDASWYGLWRFIPYLTGDGLHQLYFYTALMDDELVYYPLTEDFKDHYLTFLATAGKEGLLDPSGFTQTHEQLNAKVTEVPVYGVGLQGLTTLAGKGEKAEEYACDYVPLCSTGEKGNLEVNTGVTASALSITDKCENPEVLCAWIDYLYSEEGAKLSNLGIEGTSYTVENGMPKWVDGVQQAEWGFHAAAAAPGWRNAFTSNTFTDKAYQIQERELKAKQRDELGAPAVLFVYENEADQKRQQELYTETDAYVKTYVAQVASGQVEIEDTWDDFQKILKAMGAEELQEIYRRAYANSLK